MTSRQLNFTPTSFTSLAIDVMETKRGYMVLFAEDYLEDAKGDNCWTSWADALAVLRAKLEVTK
jgi:hypothetical protein